jgi:hypothetical protein
LEEANPVRKNLRNDNFLIADSQIIMLQFLALALLGFLNGQMEK